jgi:hypothetical protein
MAVAASNGHDHTQIRRRGPLSRSEWVSCSVNGRTFGDSQKKRARWDLYGPILLSTFPRISAPGTEIHREAIGPSFRLAFQIVPPRVTFAAKVNTDLDLCLMTTRWAFLLTCSLAVTANLAITANSMMQRTAHLQIANRKPRGGIVSRETIA